MEEIDDPSVESKPGWDEQSASRDDVPDPRPGFHHWLENRFPALFRIVFISLIFLSLFVVVTGGLFSTSSNVNHAELEELSHVKGMSNAFTMYYKKYQSYPALLDMKSNPPITEVRTMGHVLSLKLLIYTGIVEDPYAFCSSRDKRISRSKCDAMMVQPNPNLDPTFECSYAYDPGHTVNDGDTVIFGTPEVYLRRRPQEAAIVLTANLACKKLYSEQGLRLIKKGDDIYQDESKALGTKDSYLLYDSDSGTLRYYAIPVSPPAPASSGCQLR